MLLAEMKNDVTKFAEVISKILEVDVLIVDNNLKTISNTYCYPNKPIPIRNTSIIGRVISTGKTVAIEDKCKDEACKNCLDFKKCEMRGFICVPIVYKDVVVGAIALIVPDHKIPVVFGNVRNSIEFLERMADLLASKVQKSDEYTNLNLIKHERELIMDSIDYAMVSMDELGYITYYNKRFKHYFGENENFCGLFIRDIIPNKCITEFLSNYNEFSDELVYIERDNYTFYGFLSCMNININGSRGGMLFVFKSINDMNAQLAEIGYNNTSITFGSIDGGMIPPKVIDEAKRLSITSKTVLIRGETGTGKELLAKAIHTFSDRSGQYFVTVNCDGTYRSILEESLFGNQDSEQIVERLGKLQLAHKGTIYFYKVDHLPRYLQRRLAEILKSKMIHQSGRNIKVDLRMIFSTSADLEDLVQQGFFDDELYYRMSENTIHIPPLRQDKIALRKLIIGRMKFFKEKYYNEGITFDAKAFEALLLYKWPGNGKELDKVMDCIVSKFTGNVSVDDLAKLNVIELEENRPLPIRDMERESIAALLASSRSKDDVAMKLGISRATLYRKIKKYNL